MAWVGGSNYGNVQFDHVYQARRQAGSTFKPFVYAAAIDNGYKPYIHSLNTPLNIMIETEMYGILRMKPWHQSINISLREALARSLNNITVRLLPEIAGAWHQ